MALSDFYPHLGMGLGNLLTDTTTAGITFGGSNQYQVYALNQFNQGIAQQMPAPIKKAVSFLEELRDEIKEWHGELR